MLIVADRERAAGVTGTGDVLEPEHGVAAIGSGGDFALAAARAVMDGDLDAETVVRGAGDRRRHLRLHELAGDARDARCSRVRP